MSVPPHSSTLSFFIKPFDSGQCVQRVVNVCREWFAHRTGSNCTLAGLATVALTITIDRNSPVMYPLDT